MLSPLEGCESDSLDGGTWWPWLSFASGPSTEGECDMLVRLLVCRIPRVVEPPGSGDSPVPDAGWLMGAWTGNLVNYAVMGSVHRGLGAVWVG